MTQPAVTEPRPIAKHAAPPRSRRWPWVAVALVVVVLIALLAGSLWYASTLVADGASVSPRNVGYPLTVTTAGGTSATYTSGAGQEGLPADQGLMGVVSVFGGYAQTDKPEPGGRSTTRQVTSTVIGPPLAQSQQVTLDPWYYPRNPKVGLGLDYEDVAFDGQLGETTAWLIPGTSSTWVVYLHGLGATPLEGLRVARTANAAGHPVLLVRYHDDVDADGFARFGVDEWPDVEAAVQYARGHGAERVVLAGADSGGAVALAFLQKSPLASDVAGLFLDSPVVDARAALESQAAARGVPQWAASAASTVAGWRHGFDWGATDYRAAAAAMAIPTVIVHGTADDQVPLGTVQRFVAAADPRLVTLDTVDGAGHGLAWNVDPAEYEGALTGLLDRVQ